MLHDSGRTGRLPIGAVTMHLAPTPLETLARARADLRMGLPIVISGPPGQALVAAAEALAGPRLAGLRMLGNPVLAVTARRATTLKARIYDGDIARIVLPPDADMSWVASMADPADDLSMPLKGPHRTLRSGDPELARAGIRIAKSALLLPAVVLVSVSGERIPCSLTQVDVTSVSRQLDSVSRLQRVASARVPLKVSEAGRLHVFRPENGAEEHYAVEIGKPDRRAAVLARLHSACLTGDIFGSLKCDCGPQLNAALDQMGAEGTGILLYMNQEGRGIGLANKMRAYSLQDQGHDTVEANHRLGFEDDERDFRIGAEILRHLGFGRIRLLTNNPAKVEMMRERGIAVAERVPLKVGLNPLNRKYLDVKARKSGHIL